MEMKEGKICFFFHPAHWLPISFLIKTEYKLWANRKTQETTDAHNLHSVL